jgi:hypothetical protein
MVVVAVAELVEKVQVPVVLGATPQWVPGRCSQHGRVRALVRPDHAER